MSQHLKVRFEINEVCKKFKSHTLGPISFKIYENEVLGIVGKTGSGKTTIAKIIMRFSGFDSGTIFFKGKPLQSTSINQFRKKNQMMFQNHLLSVNRLLKIGKIISEPLEIESTAINISDKINSILAFFELPPTILNKYPDELSGGELQRVVFARSLILNPEFIILDEPFSNLDKEMAIRLIERIKNVRKEFGIGILIITHCFQYINLLANRIISIN